MNIDLCFTVQELNPPLVYGKTVIILDIFRTSSTIITALSHGANNILPASTPENALQLKQLYPDSLLGGETCGEKPDNFDLGNSPLEYTTNNIKNQTIILSTTNGTAAILKAKEAAAIYIGSFLNAPTLAKKMQKNTHDILLACAGSQGEYSLEDTCCAGYFLHLLKDTIKPFINDKALSALALYENFHKNLPFYLSRSKNGRALLARSQWSDIEYCCLQDSLSTIPYYTTQGIIDKELIKSGYNVKIMTPATYYSS